MRFIKSYTSVDSGNRTQPERFDGSTITGLTKVITGDEIYYYNQTNPNVAVDYSLLLPVKNYKLTVYGTGSPTWSRVQGTLSNFSGTLVVSPLKKHISINSSSLYARVIVAGSMGSGGMCTNTGSPSFAAGGGPGANGGYVTNAAYSGKAGAATAGGAAGTGGTAGTFGAGGTGGSYMSGEWGGSYGGSGGYGWYGGGGGGATLTDAGGGGGGSNYIFTSSTASQYPPGGLLNTNHYLTNTASALTGFTPTNNEVIVITVL